MTATLTDLSKGLVAAYKPWAERNKHFGEHFLSGKNIEEIDERIIYDRAREETGSLRARFASPECLTGLVEYLNSVLDEQPENGTDHGRLCQALGGYFLTAALNLAAYVKRLEGVFGKEGKPFFSVGYRLDQDCTLIALPGSHITEYGTEGKGDLVNKGRVRVMGKRAGCGRRINDYCGEVELMGSISGIDINKGIVKVMRGGKLSVNYNCVDVLGCEGEVCGKTRINFAFAKEMAKGITRPHTCEDPYIAINARETNTIGEASKGVLVMNEGNAEQVYAHENDAVTRGNIGTVIGDMIDGGKTRVVVNGKRVSLETEGWGFGNLNAARTEIVKYLSLIAEIVEEIEHAQYMPLDGLGEKPSLLEFDFDSRNAEIVRFGKYLQKSIETARFLSR